MDALGLLIGLVAGAGGCWFFYIQPNRNRSADGSQGSPAAAGGADQAAEIRRQQAEIAELRSRLAAAEEARAKAETELKTAQAAKPVPDAPVKAPVETKPAPAPTPAPTAQNAPPTVADGKPKPSQPSGAAAPAAKPAPAPTPTAVAASPSAKPVATVDDLTQIKGIGPSLRDKLNGLGISSFAQIAALSAADIDRISNELNVNANRIRRDWVRQAQELAGS